MLLKIMNDAINQSLENEIQTSPFEKEPARQTGEHGCCAHSREAVRPYYRSDLD